MKKIDTLSLKLEDYDHNENIPAKNKINSLSLELEDYDCKEVLANKMKKKRDLLSLGLYNYNRKDDIIPAYKKAKTVSLSLSGHPSESSVPRPSQPDQTHKKLRLFGFYISIEEKVNPNSPQTNKQPRSSSDTNLEKPFRAIFDQSAGPSSVQKMRRSKPNGKSRLYQQDNYFDHHHRHNSSQILEQPHSSSNPNLQKRLRVIFNQSAGPNGVPKKSISSISSKGESRLYNSYHHHQELLHPNSTQTHQQSQSSSNPDLEKPSRVIFDQSAGPSGVKKKKSPKPSKGKSIFYKQDDNSEHNHQELSPEILERIQSNGGTTQPVFLFQKRLTNSDTKPYLNRIFLSGNPKKLLDFLTEVERHEVTDGQGVEVVTIDPKGDYYNLKLTKWESLDMIVLKREWYKLAVKANQLQGGDLVQLWGYRLNAEFRLALQISRKDQRRSGSADDGSGRSTVSTA